MFQAHNQAVPVAYAAWLPAIRSASVLRYSRWVIGPDPLAVGENQTIKCSPRSRCKHSSETGYRAINGCGRFQVLFANFREIDDDAQGLNVDLLMHVGRSNG